MSEQAKQCTPEANLHMRLMSACEQKSELEWYAKRLIEKTESELSAMTQRAEAAETELAENRKLAHTNMQTMHDYKRRAEAAEARIKASQKQEPLGYIKVSPNGQEEPSYLCKQLAMTTFYVYRQPIPPDVAELQRENAELTRKAGEQHNVLKYLMDRFDSETWQCENCGYTEDTGTMDSAIYLREYLAAAPQPGGSNG